MTKESDKYEHFIAKLVGDISSTHRDIVFLCSGATCRLMGDTGQKHQIDVAFIDRTFAPPKLVLIECKLKTDPKLCVTPDVAKVLFFNGQDITKNPQYPNDFSLIICSTNGFASGTKKIADSLGIKLESVSFSLDYTFRYEDIILASVSEVVGWRDDATCIVRHVDGTQD